MIFVSFNYKPTGATRRAVIAQTSGTFECLVGFALPNQLFSLCTFCSPFFFFFFWPLHGLSFFNIRILITLLVSSNFYMGPRYNLLVKKYVIKYESRTYPVCQIIITKCEIYFISYVL